MEHALGDVQELVALDAELADRRQQGPEVVVGGLVRPDVLGRDDRREAAMQLGVAGGEAVAVHVGHDDQQVVLGQAGEGVARVGERRPLTARNRRAASPSLG